MKILRVSNNLLLATRKICDRSPDNDLIPKTKWHKGVTQGAVACLFYWKSTSFVEIMSIETKRNLVQNNKWTWFISMKWTFDRIPDDRILYLEPHISIILF